MCVSYNMNTCYAQHKISTLHLVPSPTSIRSCCAARVTANKSLTWRFWYPKNTWTAISFWWIFVVVEMAGNVRGKLSLFWFLFNLLSVSPLVVCHELWYIPTWQIIYGIGKRKVGKPVEWLYRYPILDKAACWWIFATLSRPTSYYAKTGEKAEVSFIRSQKS